MDADNGITTFDQLMGLLSLYREMILLLNQGHYYPRQGHFYPRQGHYYPRQGRDLESTDETYSQYDALQYILLHPGGEDGWTDKVYYLIPKHEVPPAYPLLEEPSFPSRPRLQ
jgi:hypothetical protein